MPPQFIIIIIIITIIITYLLLLLIAGQVRLKKVQLHNPYVSQNKIELKLCKILINSMGKRINSI